MLERFKPKKEDQVRISSASLRETVTAMFEKMGVPPEAAADGADVLTMTDLRGVETHGVSNMMRVYVNQFRDGTLNPTPEVKIVHETPATATLDADRGLGILVGRQGMTMAIEKAKETGFGVVTMSRSGHIGAVGHFATIAAQHDMVGMCMTAGGTGVVPTFGGEGRLGANPISIAAPARNEAPLLFDVATSAVAMNKTQLALRVGSKLLPGWVAENDGTPIMEEVEPKTYEGFLGLTIGGTREQGSHKGYGFSVMVEVLCSMLSGSVPSMFDETPRESMFKNYFAAYNIEAFTDLDLFKDNMDQMLNTLKTTKPAPGHDRVLYPGLSEAEEIEWRTANGIPLHKEVVEWFDNTCDELSLGKLQRV